VDDDRIVYVADTYNNRVVEWHSGAKNGQVVVGRNEKGTQHDQLDHPTDVILDKKTGSLIVCDKGNRRIVRGFQQRSLPTEIIMSNIYCGSLTKGDGGSLYIFDLVMEVVTRWYPRRRYEGSIVAPDLLGFGASYYVFIDELVDYPNQPVYLSHNHTTRIMKWVNGVNKGVVVNDSRNQVADLSQLSNPQGLVVDQLGTIYVADRLNHRILRWPKGVTQGSTIVGGNGKGNQSNQLDNPRSLSFDLHGNLYVADAGNHRVQRFDIIRNT
jgi:sugar lactone lactonase YvrE